MSLDTVMLTKEDCFDLALRKTTNTQQVIAGQEFDFTITVFNQGEVAAYDVEVTDNLPADISLSANDANGWTNLGGNVLQNTIPFIAAGDSVSLTLLVQVSASPSNFGFAVNYAEISFATKDDNSGIPTDDFDSTADTDPNNDNGGTPGNPAEDDNIDDDGTIDEDDHDPAQVEILETSGLGDWVFNDINRNGKQDLGEPGVGGVTITLYDGNTNLPLATTESDPFTGYYEFTGLLSGIYYVVFDHGTAPTHFVPTIQDAQSNGMDAMDSDADENTGQSHTVFLPPGVFNPTIDAGYYEVENGHIDGYAWIDCDKNGLREPGEDILPNVPVMLIGTTDNGDPVNESTTTDSNGYYFFSDVEPGSYTVKFSYPTSPTGLQLTDMDAGNDNFDSDVDPTTGVTLPFVVMQEDSLAFDAGFQDVEGPVVIPKDPDLIGVNDGDTLSFMCGMAPVLDMNLVMAMDNVDPDPEVVFIERIVSLGDCENTGSLMLMECGWLATDTCGNQTHWKVYIKVVDNDPPMLMGIPADIMVDCENIPTPPVVTAEDMCDDNVEIDMTETVSAGNCPYTITRVWTATDDCGNFSTASQLITVTDQVAPVITQVPNDTTVECGYYPPFDPNTVLATDNCDLDLDITYFDYFDSTSICPYIIERNIIATDNCNNSDTVVQVITIIDTQVPVFSNVPNDTTITCDVAVPILSQPTATDVCDATVSITETIQTYPGACPQESRIEYTWIAEDECGNFVTATANIYIIDTVAPVLSNIPVDMVIECNDPFPNVFPTVVDNCDIAPDLLVSIDTIVSNPCTTSVIRNFLVTDACGNSSTASHRVTIYDNTAPNIAPINPFLFGIANGDTVTVSCDQFPEFDTSDVKVTDNCDPNPTVLFEDLAVITGDCPVDGFLTLMLCSWTARDACGNQSSYTIYIKVVDNEPPVLTGVSPRVIVNCIDSIPPIPVVTADDNCTPFVQVQFEEEDRGGDCFTGRTIVRTWTATDNCGNTTSESQQITLIDNQPPILIGVPADEVVNCTNSIPTPPNVTVSDNCSNPVLQYSEVDLGGDCTSGRTFIRTWTATDGCGNQTTATQRITLIDDQPPVLTGVPADITISCNDSLPSVANVIATDNCGTPGLTYNEQITGTDCATGITYTRTWTATDDCGTSVTATQVITVIDNEAPVLTGVPANMNVSCEDDVPPVAVVTVSDNCSTPDLIFNEIVSGNNCATGIIRIRTWSATDDCGNQVQASQTITILDNEPPVLNGVPGNLNLSCIDSLPAVAMVTATDNCGNTDIIFNETITGSNCATGITYRRTWTATDDCGNQTTRTQRIVIRDNEAPVLSGVPSNITINCVHHLPPPANVVATDNCGTPDLVFDEVVSGTDCALGISYTRTWTATDACGNVSSASQVITVIDDRDPVLNGVPADLTISCIDSLPLPANVTATDNCGPALVEFEMK
ncbi:MAG: SdrD B-like domain-containing protein [Saprospiraceae bacterium]